MSDTSGDATIERFEVRRTVLSDARKIFEVLSDPRGHVQIDSSGTLMASEGSRVTAVGDSFVMHMDGEALNDRPIGAYSVTVTITRFEEDRLIEWTVGSEMLREPLRHVYGYALEPVPEGTRVTAYYDWSQVPDRYRSRLFPVIPEAALRATLGILARVVQPPPATAQ